ncbi:MAG: hypothetical protein ABMA64_42190 [Myxococcota bacterium]
MSVLVWAACTGWAAPGELWLTVRDVEADGDKIVLDLPASSLRDPGAPVEIETAAGKVDLRPIARELGVGDERSFALDDGATAELRHEPPADGRSAELVIVITGKGGGAATFQTPIARDALQQKLEVDLGPMAIDDAAVAQWARCPPREVVAVVGPKGNGLRISTR